jgi:SRSO17 transposase
MVVPIVSIPASIEAGLVPYRDLFPRPETYQPIKEYCTGLVVLEKPSINRLATCLVEGPAQSSINQALTRSPWSGEAVNQRRLEQIQKHHRGKGLRRGIIDSTFSHPPGGEEDLRSLSVLGLSTYA